MPEISGLSPSLPSTRQLGLAKVSPVKDIAAFQRAISGAVSAHPALSEDVDKWMSYFKNPAVADTRVSWFGVDTGSSISYGSTTFSSIMRRGASSYDHASGKGDRETALSRVSGELQDYSVGLHESAGLVDSSQAARLISMFQDRGVVRHFLENYQAPPEKAPPVVESQAFKSGASVVMQMSDEGPDGRKVLSVSWSRPGRIPEPANRFDASKLVVVVPHWPSAPPSRAEIERIERQISQLSSHPPTESPQPSSRSLGDLLGRIMPLQRENADNRGLLGCTADSRSEFSVPINPKTPSELYDMAIKIQELSNAKKEKWYVKLEYLGS